jgi:hypothetical protein
MRGMARSRWRSGKADRGAARGVKPRSPVRPVRTRTPATDPPRFPGPKKSRGACALAAGKTQTRTKRWKRQSPRPRVADPCSASSAQGRAPSLRFGPSGDPCARTGPLVSMTFCCQPRPARAGLAANVMVALRHAAATQAEAPGLDPGGSEGARPCALDGIEPAWPRRLSPRALTPPTPPRCPTPPTHRGGAARSARSSAGSGNRPRSARKISPA